MKRHYFLLLAMVTLLSAPRAFPAKEKEGGCTRGPGS